MRRSKRIALGSVGALLAVLLLLNCGSDPMRIEPLATVAIPRVTDANLELARRYAPILFHAVGDEVGRQDIPSRCDYDGDMRGDNNWDHFPRFTLEPTVYYTALETATHWFLTYHVFHPRDWSLVRIGVHLTHENDGENLQVVVDKESGRVVLLFAQAHYRGRVYTSPDSGFDKGDVGFHGRLVLCDDEGRPDDQGHHAAVFISHGGHAIYGALDGRADLDVTDDEVRFTGGGIVLRPSRPGEAVTEPDPDQRGPWPYVLESTVARFWTGVRDGSLLGDGGILDGTLPYAGPYGEVPVPRYYEADRFSGPFGPDRGIAPFAVDFGFSAGEVGALFYDPARRYEELLVVPQPWSTEYVDYPFR